MIKKKRYQEPVTVCRRIIRYEIKYKTNFSSLINFLFLRALGWISKRNFFLLSFLIFFPFEKKKSLNFPFKTLKMNILIYWMHYYTSSFIFLFFTTPVSKPDVCVFNFISWFISNKILIRVITTFHSNGKNEKEFGKWRKQLWAFEMYSLFYINPSCNFLFEPFLYTSLFMTLKGKTATYPWGKKSGRYRPWNKKGRSHNKKLKEIFLATCIRDKQNRNIKLNVKDKLLNAVAHTRGWKMQMSKFECKQQTHLN